MAGGGAVLIRNGTVVNADRTEAADVLVEGGVVAAVGRGLACPPGAREIDATGKLLLPGGIDPHTHCQLPFMGTVAVDDFEAGTRAAICGGTTTLIDFVIPKPGESLLRAFDTWMEWARPACCDYAFHVAVTWFGDQVREEMAILTRERGVNSFKHFLAYKGALMLDDEALVASFSRAKELGALATVHAENGELVLMGQRRLLAAGVTGPEGHPQSRPPEVEGEATNRAARIAQVINEPLYVVHVSCKDAVDVVARARREGQIIFGETLCQHLVLDDRKYWDPDWRVAAAYVMSPPFRPVGHQEALWTGLQSGDLLTTASDHCTFTGQQKSMGRDDFSRIPNGCNGLEERMALLWTNGVRTGRLRATDFVAVTSTNAAKIFNMYPKKGAIAVGSDADIVVWDPELRHTFSVRTHHSRCDYNVYEGMEAVGGPAIVLVHGVVAYENGAFVGHAGAGKYLPRACFGMAFDGVAQRDALRTAREQPVARK